MQGHSRLPSRTAVAVALSIALLSVAGCVLALRISNEHERQLLNSEAQQTADLMRVTMSNLYQSMGSVATAATLAANDPQQYQRLSFKIVAQANTSIALVQHLGPGAYIVRDSVGPAFTQGQVIAGPLETAIATANPAASAARTVTPTTVSNNGTTVTFGFVLGPPATPDTYAVYEQITAPLRLLGAGPFNAVNFALYASHQQAPADLVLDNSSSIPLKGEISQTLVPVGDATWLAVVSARGPLTGSLSRDAGWVILGMGLLIALLVGLTIDVIARRRKYLEVQVNLRTAELAQAMADLREAQAALVQRERLAAIGQMASVIGHELRNPLTAVTNALYLVRTGLGAEISDRMRGNLDLAEREVQRAAAVAQDITDFVRPRKPQPEPFTLDRLVSETLEAAPPPANINVSTRVGRITVLADWVQLGEVVTNLVTNAYQAMPDGGEVQIWADRVGEKVRMGVQDNGPGIPPDVAKTIFDPFVTTKTRGTGLGLAIVRRIVEDHGGNIELEDFDGPGTRFVIRLPAMPLPDGRPGGTEQPLAGVTASPAASAGAWAGGPGTAQAGSGPADQAP